MLRSHALMLYHRLQQSITERLRGSPAIRAHGLLQPLQPEECALRVESIGHAVGIDQQGAAWQYDEPLLVERGLGDDA